MKKIVIIFILCAFKLYPLVVVDYEVSVKSKQLFIWQKLFFTIRYEGELDTFYPDGIDEKEINDFEIIGKEIVSSVNYVEGNVKVLTHKIKYELKPIKKGRVYIPNLIVNYYVVSSDSTLKREYEEIPRIDYYVGSFGLLLIPIGIFIFVFLVLLNLYLFIRKQQAINEKLIRR